MNELFHNAAPNATRTAPPLAPPRTYPHDKPSQVYLFGTCVVDLFYPEAGMDSIRLLEREGIRVNFPQAQSCCGQPAYTSGYTEEARAVARAQLALFAEPWPVVVPSGSCAGMLRHHYAELFADEPETLRQVQDLAERTYELAEFLLNVCQVDYQDRGAPTKVALHTSCSARREMQTHLHGRALLGQLQAVERSDHDHESEVCGFYTRRGRTAGIPGDNGRGTLPGCRCIYGKPSGSPAPWSLTRSVPCRTAVPPRCSPPTADA